MLGLFIVMSNSIFSTPLGTTGRARVVVEGNFICWVTYREGDSLEVIKGVVSEVTHLSKCEFRLVWGDEWRSPPMAGPQIGGSLLVSLRLLGGSRAGQWEEGSLAEELGCLPTASGAQRPCCRPNISDRFSALDTQLPPPAADVLEHYCVDDSVKQGMGPPADYEACAAMLGSHPPTAYYPPEFFRGCLPKHADWFVYGPSEVGGHGITARRRIPKGTFFCYEGALQRNSDANEYTLAIPAAVSPLIRSGQVLYIDGSVSPTSLLGGMNEFIWDNSLNQFEFGEAGLVRALRDVPKGACCFIGYGENYDWDGLKLTLVHELSATLVAGVKAFGHKTYKASVAEIAAEMVGWTVESLPWKRAGSGLERLLMAVVDNKVPTDLTHTVFPGFLSHDGIPEPVGCWLERFLCSAMVIGRSAFRRAQDPRFDLLPLKSCMTVMAAGVWVSPRSKARVNYDVESVEDFPTLPGLVKTKGARRVSIPLPVVELTEHNDPLRGRLVSLAPAGLTTDELEEMVLDSGEFELLGGLENSVGEWTMSMKLLKNEAGKDLMRQMLGWPRTMRGQGGGWWKWRRPTCCSSVG